MSERWHIEERVVQGTRAVVISRGRVNGFAVGNWMHASGGKDVVAVVVQEKSGWRCRPVDVKLASSIDPMAELLADVPGLEALLARPG